MPRTTLPWPSYKAQADNLFKQGLKPAQIKEKLGDPYWEGKPWHIKSNGRGGISRMTLKARQQGKALSDTTRKRNLQLNPPQNQAEVNQNRRQNYKARSLNGKGANVHIDHKIDLKLLAETVEGMTPEQAKAHIQRLEQSYGPLGNRPGNRQIIGAHTNGVKASQTRALQRHLRDMSHQSNPLQQLQQLANLAANRGTGMLVRGVVPWLSYLPEIDQASGGHIDDAINNGIDSIRSSAVQQLSRLAEAIAFSKPPQGGSTVDYGQ